MSTTTETTSQPGPLGFAQMAGSSIAGRGAAAWVTDFLNAAYYRRPAEDRDVDDLRLAFCVLTTYWYRKQPGAPAARHRPAGLPPRVRRASASAPRSARGMLDREALLRGAAALLGDWFPEAYADDARRALGHRLPEHDRARAPTTRAPAWSSPASAS